jgi:hypothetical protein
MASIRALLSRIAGVWVGTYTKVDTQGRVLDRFASRQETRLRGDRWFERIEYTWDDGRFKRLDFRATVRDDAGLVFDVDTIEGDAIVVTPDITVFPYRWRDRPDQNIVETVALGDDDHRSRVWQAFERGDLAFVMIVHERRVAETPVEWE